MSTFFPYQTVSHLSKENSKQLQSSQVRVVYEQVIRKNQQIMKSMLSKMSDLYNRNIQNNSGQQQYENSLVDLNEKMKQIAESNKNLHHEMRATHLQIEKKQHILVDDIKKVKTGINMPGDHITHEEYLSSNFFKEHTNMINGRARSRRNIRNKTNFVPEKSPDSVHEDDNQQFHKGALEVFRQRSTANLTQAPYKYKTEQAKQIAFQEKKSINLSIQALNDRSGSQNIQKLVSQLQEKNNELQQKLQRDLVEMNTKQKQANKKIEEIQNETSNKLEKMNKEIIRENQLGKIDFQGLYTYLDDKVKQHIADKINKKYFEETLNNLQDAVQAQLNRIYLLMEQKLSKIDLIHINDKIGQLKIQVQGWNNLNSLKIQNLSYNSTAKSTPFKINFERSSIEQNQSNLRIPRQTTDENKPKKHQLKYCHSTSAIHRAEERKEIRSGDEEVSQHKWKKRVVMAIGVNKQLKIRRGERS